jgi:hypothetical protein
MGEQGNHAHTIARGQRMLAHGHQEAENVIAVTRVTSISYKFHSDSCGDDETAAAFGRWAEAELQRRYPDADVRVGISYNTSGARPPVRVNTNATDWAESGRIESETCDKVDRLWADWERAGWRAACRRFGAQRVYSAAVARLSGSHKELRALGLDAPSLAHANAIMSAAHGRLNDQERAADLADATVELARIGSRMT